MDQVGAIYQQGVFKPLQPVDLEEDQRFRLHVEPSPNLSMEQWLQRVREHQETIIEREGFFPDSTPGIAKDRLRGNSRRRSI